MNLTCLLPLTHVLTSLRPFIAFLSLLRPKIDGLVFQWCHFSLFTLPSSLFTLHSSMFTLHSFTPASYHRRSLFLTVSRSHDLTSLRPFIASMSHLPPSIGGLSFLWCLRRSLFSLLDPISLFTYGFPFDSRSAALLNSHKALFFLPAPTVIHSLPQRNNLLLVSHI